MRLGSENEILHMMYIGKADLCDTSRAFSVQKDVKKLIEEECRKRLRIYEVPAYITEIKEIPLTVNGKLDEECLAELSEVQASADEPITMPASDDITEKVYSIYLRQSGQEYMRTDQNIWEAGINSLAATKIWRELQEEFGIRFNIAAIFEKANIINMADYVRELTGTATSTAPVETSGVTGKLQARNELRKSAVRRRMQRR